MVTGSAPRSDDGAPSQLRIGVLGGSFDPPHIGHLVVAAEARWQLGLDRVVLVPTGHAPHKVPTAMADAELRHRWCQALATEAAGLVVSRIELERSGPSYSADTVAALAAAEPGAALWFLMGSDQLEALPGWHQPQRLLEHTRLAVVPRPPHTLAEVIAIGERVAPGRVDPLDAPRLELSSTMIRARLAAGRPVRHLVPGPVWEVLRADGLVASDALE